MSELPRGWEWQRVVDIADVRLGRQRSPKNHSGDHMRPYLRAANVSWSGLKLDDVKEMNFTPAESLEYELRDGDILLNEASGSPSEVGKPAIWRGEVQGACFQNTLLRVRSRGPLPEYLHLYFWHTARAGRFGDLGRGVNIRHLGKQALAEFVVPVPPMAEQQRIVEATQDLLSRVRAADLELVSARSRLRSLRSAALRTVVDPAQSEVRWGTVEEAGIVDLGRQRSPKYHNGPDMRPYLRVKNVFEDRIDLTDVMEMNFPPADAKRYELKYGDILLNEGQSPELLGRPAMYRNELPGACFTNSLIRFRARDHVDPEYALLVFLNFLHSRRFMRESRITTNIAHLAAGRFKKIEFPMLDLQEQKRLVRLIRSQLEHADRLECAIKRAQSRSSALKGTILAAAFSGRLTELEAVSV